MGNTANVTVIGDPKLIEVARRRIDELESRWSRFRASSDITRLNHAEGRHTPVHSDTVRLLAMLQAAQQVTLGVFDPTLTPALIAAGYDRSMRNDLATSSVAATSRIGVSLADAQFDEMFDAITLPFGATIDPGGLGKGLAADIVTEELLERGADGVCIAIGGDIRCAGIGPVEGRWPISVADPIDGRINITTVVLDSSGIATSHLQAKTWMHSGESMHHLFDPTTAAPVAITATSIVQATVIATDAAWAEVYATVALITQSADSLLDSNGRNFAALLVRADGTVTSVGSWKEFVRG
jgi:thiamine biosynthesis lipoprotein